MTVGPFPGAAVLGFGAAFVTAAFLLWRPKRPLQRAPAAPRSPYDEVLLAPPKETGDMARRRRVIAFSGGFTAAVPESLLASRVPWDGLSGDELRRTFKRVDPKDEGVMGMHSGGY